MRSTYILVRWQSRHLMNLPVPIMHTSDGKIGCCSGVPRLELDSSDSIVPVPAQSHYTPIFVVQICYISSLIPLQYTPPLHAIHGHNHRASMSHLRCFEGFCYNRRAVRSNRRSNAHEEAAPVSFSPFDRTLCLTRMSLMSPAYIAPVFASCRLDLVHIE